MQERLEALKKKNELQYQGIPEDEYVVCSITLEELCHLYYQNQ